MLKISNSFISGRVNVQALEDLHTHHYSGDLNSQNNPPSFIKRFFGNTILSPNDIQRTQLLAGEFKSYNAPYRMAAVVIDSAGKALWEEIRS